MKKMLIFTVILVGLLAAIFFVTKSEKKTDYYEKQISVEELQKQLKNQKDMTIYFYQPTCTHCQKVSPTIVPMAKDMNIDMKVLDLVKYDAGWDAFKIEYTPTLVRYKNGVEVDRIVGEHTKDEFKAWFEKNH
ncbi:thioredoxin family protein [Ectobacillus ponti]|uniref:Thioredoxin family protein n=1 Tax=Ectobacillus ponti TaxID=2961894 RepID=A0AA41X6L2_9BACI|nr:thioredoxin family protein [Ectobacillus ponti]MCP8968148.1 thioredoxin family protein [Ectobacillus ponti]